jgi:thiol-disulfide isomerase/thioredoxin
MNYNNYSFPPLAQPTNFVSKMTSNISFTNTIIIFAVILLIVVICLYYFGILDLSPKYKPNNEKISIEGGNNKYVEILFFFTNWCPHCKTAKPVWEELKKEYENKTVNGYNIIFTDVDCTEETAEVDSLMNKYNVEGYPTIKLLKDGQVIEYDAKPSKDTLVQFLNTVV